MKTKQLLIIMFGIINISILQGQIHRLIRLDQSFDDGSGTNLVMVEHSLFNYDNNYRPMQGDFFEDSSYTGTLSHIYQDTIVYNPSNGKIAEIDKLYDDMQYSNKRYISYTGTNQIMVDLTLKYDTLTSTYVNDKKTMFSYQNSASTFPLTITDFVWDSGVWKPIKKYTYTYDSNGNVLTGIIQEASSPNYILQNSKKFIKTYDTSQRISNFKYQDWTGASWNSVVDNNYSYSNVGSNSQITLIKTLSNSKNVYLLDINGNLISEKRYNLVSGSYLKYTKTEFVRNTSTGTIFISNYNANTNGTSWQTNAFHKREYYYDMSVPKTDLALPLAWQLPHEFYFPYTLLDQGLPKFDQFQYKWLDYREYWRNNVSGPFIEVANADFYYDTITSSVNEQETITVNVYPNPFVENIKIETKENRFDFVLYDLNGKKVYQANDKENGDNLKPKNLKKGIYLYEVITSKGTKRGKIIKH